ncbi:MAG: methyltransferase [Parafilimonas sp.]
MKVCTDACLFGAWAADYNLQPVVHRLLDIGTGTGLLSLMLAQKLPDVIMDAVEIDEAAAQQAKENFEASPWKERLNVYNTSIQQFAETTAHKYDIIICNPPFYENDLKSGDAKRNLALHSAELRLGQLIAAADTLLNDGGRFFALLPYFRTEEFEALIDGKFFVREKALVKQSGMHDYFRSMFLLTKQEGSPVFSEMSIMNEDGNYTEAFVGLLQTYYLKL